MSALDPDTLRHRPAPFKYPDHDSLPDALRKEVDERQSLNVYKMLMHTPRVAPGFLAFTDALRHRSSLPGSWRGLAILRVEHCYKAPYEIHHHERLARIAGLREEVILCAGMESSNAVFNNAERIIVQLTDELLEVHGLSAQSRARALKQLGANQLADLVLTIGYYQMVCGFLNTFAVPIEE